MEINPARFVDLPMTGMVKVGKVLCIGRNYARHAAEMKSNVPETPMVFLKPSTALTPDGSEIILPRDIGEVHHEVELVAAIGRTLRHVPRADALDGVAGFAVGLDMTARDVQAAAKSKGHPWSVAKGYDTFAPVGRFVPAHSVHADSLAVSLEINGRSVQAGSTSDMVFDIATLVAYCSSIFTLEPGDLLFTGTPEGVGPVSPGDSLVARVDGLPELRVSVQEAAERGARAFAEGG